MRNSHKIVDETSQITTATSKENHCNMQTTRPPYGLLVGIHGRGRCRSSIQPSGSSKGQRHAHLISSHGRAAASYKSRPGKACPLAAQLVLALTAAKRRSSSRRPLLWPGADLPTASCAWCGTGEEEEQWARRSPPAQAQAAGDCARRGAREGSRRRDELPPWRHHPRRSSAEAR